MHSSQRAVGLGLLVLAFGVADIVIGKFTDIAAHSFFSVVASAWPSESPGRGRRGGSSRHRLHVTRPPHTLGAAT